MNLFGFALILIMLCIIGIHFYRIKFVNQHPHNGDAFTYLRVAKEIKKQKTLFPEMSFYYTGEVERFNLPPLLMASMAPVSAWPYQVLIHLPFVYDLAIAALIYLGAIQLFTLSEQQALLAASVYLLTPINAITNASLTPRSLGLLWFTAFLYAMTAYLQTQNGFWLVAASVAIALALLSQRMVTQIIILLTPLVAVVLLIQGVTGWYWPVVCVMAGFGLALLLTKGQYRAVFADHLARVLLHAKLGHQDRFTKEFGNPGQIIKANPWALITAVFMAISLPTLTPTVSISLAYAVGMLILAVVWVMGNSVNHVYFCGPLIAWLLAANLPVRGWAYGLMILVAFVCAWIAFREYRAMRKRHLSSDWLECLQFIRDQQMSGRALVLPQVSFPPLIYYTDLVMVSSGHGSKAITYDRMTIKNNINDPEFVAKFIKDSGISVLILDKNVEYGKRLDVGFIKLFDNNTLNVVYIN